MSIGYVVVVQRLHSDAYGLGAGPKPRLPVIPSPPQGYAPGICPGRHQFSVSWPRIWPQNTVKTIRTRATG